MKIYAKAMVLGTMILGGCGAPADRAENIPVSGKWSDEGKLMSIKAGGTAIDITQVPGLAALKEKVNQTKEFCGEPYFLNKDDFQKAIDKNNPAGCEITSVEASGNRVNAKGSCKKLQLSNSEGEGWMEGVSIMEPEKVVYDMTIHVVVRSPQTGAGEKVTMEARRTLTRLGDC